MKILLSAYACEPNRGSEPGVGWHRALEAARLGHHVTVITRANNRASIELALQSNPTGQSIEFVYFDLPSWAKCWKKGTRGIHLYYLLWQWGAYRQARKLHQLKNFDLVHHVTFVSIRQPSFMGWLGIPFIFGPVSGGDSIPAKLRFGMGWRGWLHDLLRDAANCGVRFDPLMWITFSSARAIFVTSEKTRLLVPKRFQCKTKKWLAIGLESALSSPPSKPQLTKASLRILYVGNLVHCKGMNLGIPAFAQLLKTRPDARLTVIGTGPEEQRLRQIAAKTKSSDNINWIPWVEHDKLSEFYNSHDIFLFPSLRDSGGMVVLEAMAHALPVICLDLGGPGTIVRGGGGIAIPVSGRGSSEVISLIANQLRTLAHDEELRRRLSSSALQRAQEMTWEKLAAEFSATYGEQKNFLSANQ